MSLRIVVEAKDSMIDGLSWREIFSGAFPNRRFQLLESPSEGELLLVHVCSPAMESVFRYATLAETSPILHGYIKGKMPMLLDLYGEDDDEDEEAEDEDDDAIYADDVSQLMQALLTFATEMPDAKVVSGSVAGLREEAESLSLLMRVADANVYDVRWER